MVRKIWGAIDFGLRSSPDWIRNTQNAFGLSSASFASGACLLEISSSRVNSATPDRSRFSIVASARLHNRTDLISHLGIAGERSSNDNELILASYLKWGAECGRHLLGEFSFAIWDHDRRELFCCRDHIGFRPFVYYYRDNRFVFSHDVSWVLRTPGIPKQLNRRKFAGMSVFGGYALYDEDTFHAGIQSLPPGTSLTVSGSGVRKRRFWEPGSGCVAIPRKRGEIFEALRELLIDAVECRIDDGEPFAAELSGGLDSSAIVAIAADFQRKKGKTLLAFSNVLPDESLKLYEDERQYANEFSSWPNIRIEYVTAEGLGPFDGLEDAQQFAATPVRASTHYLQTALATVARFHGTSLRLRGLQGEMGPTADGDRYLVELAVKLRWLELWKQLKEIERVQHLQPLSHLAREFVGLTGYQGGWRSVPYIFLTRDFLRHGRALRPFFSTSPNERRYQLAAIRNNLRSHSPYRGRFPQDNDWFSFPWLDKRVIEFCLAVPSELKIQNGYRRNLIREALDGILPQKIQWRVSKTQASPDYNVRYNSQLPKAKEFVASIRPNDPIRAIIDVEKLTAAMRPTEPLKSNAVAMHTVPANLYAICFLRQFPEFSA